ncbi:MAG: pre-toxin TG domain-containing protein [Minicystis sp.]
MSPPLPQSTVDTTFRGWWSVFGSTPATVARALARTKSQIGGAMPPGYVPPPWRSGVHAATAADAPAGKAPFQLPVERVDVTFNAWWKELGRTPETIAAALQKTKQQIGGPMPPGYVPPPLRAPPPPPAPPRENDGLLQRLLGAPQASGLPAPIPEIIQTESPEGKSLFELRAREKLLVDWLGAQTASSDAVEEVQRELAAVERAINLKLTTDPIAAAIDQGMHGPSPAVSAGARAAAQGLPLGQVLRLHVSEEQAQRFISDYLEYCQRSPDRAEQYLKARAEEERLREQVKELWAAQEGIQKLGNVREDRMIDLSRRLFGPAPQTSLGARAASRFLPLSAVFKLDLSPLEMEQFLDDYQTYAHRYELMAPELLRGYGVDVGREIAFYQEQERRIEELRLLLVPQKKTAFELAEVDKPGSGWHPVFDPRTKAIVGYWRERQGVTKVIDRDGKILQMSEIPLEDPLKPVLQAADIAIAFVPIVGEVLMACEAISGYDLAGDKLSATDRAFAAAGAIPFLFKVPALLKVIPRAERILEVRRGGGGVRAEDGPVGRGGHALPPGALEAGARPREARAGVSRAPGRRGDDGRRAARVRAHRPRARGRGPEVRGQGDLGSPELQEALAGGAHEALPGGGQAREVGRRAGRARGAHRQGVRGGVRARALSVRPRPDGEHPGHRRVREGRSGARAKAPRDRGPVRDALCADDGEPARLRRRGGSDRAPLTEGGGRALRLVLEDWQGL